MTRFHPLSPILVIQNGWVAVEREGTGAGNPHIHDLTEVALGALEDDDLVAAGAAREAIRPFLARPFDKNLHVTAYEATMALAADLIDEGQQALVSLFFERLLDLVGHIRCRGVLAGRIFEDKGLVEFDLSHKRQGLIEILLGFSRETHDDVGADADVGFYPAQLFNDGEIALSGVAAMHQFQQAVAAALDWQMSAFDQLRQAAVGF